MMLQVSIHTPTQGVTFLDKVIISYFKVSIHTPTQGVTYIRKYNAECSGVSIHTPTQGVTTCVKPSDVCPKSFNPHTHAGCDSVPLPWRSTCPVSIHTPTQGVTTTAISCTAPLSVSIHTPTQGVTLYLITYYKSANLIHCYANHHYYSTS